MGIFKLNGIDYMGGGGGGNTNYEELTQLEYDALTEQEKNNGTIYFITDANSNKDSKFQPIIYSEEEREIGVWVNGKPLYEKTVNLTYDNFGSYSSIRYKDLSIGNISIIDTLVNIHGYVITKTYGAINIPLGYSGWDDTTSFGCYTHSTSTDYMLTLMYNVNNFTSEDGVIPATVTIQYTKTTDSPGSGKWTPQGVPAHHYSTEEQIVGTWVDGKTVYEQTIIGNAISDTGINILWERTDIDTVVEYNCIFLDGDNLEYNANYYYSTGAYFRVFVDTQSVWTNTKGIVCQRSSNQAINGTRLTVLYTKSLSQGGN